MDKDESPSGLKIPDEDGTPKDRIRHAHQVWDICDELRIQDDGRAKKRSRIYKAYNRFPPTEYSKLVKEGQWWQSNVNFGMLSFVVDNNLASFYDMVTERNMAAEIKTKKGNDMEKSEWSEHISTAFDYVLKCWDSHLLNVEQDLLDMLLFTKGVQMIEDEDGCLSEHVAAHDILFPDGAKVTLCNVDVFAIRRDYTISQLWSKVSAGSGWNKKAVLSAMRHSRVSWKDKYKTEEDFLHDIGEGNVTVADHLKETIETYICFVKQFDGTISKYCVLRDYAQMLNEDKAKAGGGQAKLEDTIDKDGFLYEKRDFAKEFSDFITLFMDCAGSGSIHRITSLAEKVFVQCRQYDITMNAIMDAVKVNMSLMLQAQDGDASDKIKNLTWGPYTIIPSDVPFVQQRFSLPVQEATGAVQFMMLDMFRGIGEYRINERASSGQPVTATQNANDTAEAARLSGTQIKRYNEQLGIYYRMMYKKLVEQNTSSKDYEMFKKFKEYLEEKGVPKEAWKFESIVSIKSNILAGAGSPAYKLMAAEKTIALTNISPKDEGQSNAVRDALAAVNGRSNVDRYSKRIKPDKSWNEQKAGWENEMLANPFVNPDDVQVMPEDNDTEHTLTHIGDMERTIALVNDKMQKGQISEYVAECAAYRILYVGSHVMGHLEVLKKDEMKQEFVKEQSQRLNQIQQAADQLQKQMQQMMEQKQQGVNPMDDPKVALDVARSQIEIDSLKKKQDIKLASQATSHQQKLQHNEEAAASDIAINRAKEIDKIRTKQKAENARENK